MQKRSSTETVLALPRSVKRMLALTADVCLCVLTVWLAICFRFEAWVSLQGNQWLAVALSPLLAIPLFIVSGLYRAIFRYVDREAFMAVLRAVSIYTLIYSTIFTAIGFADVPRTIGILQPVLLLLSVGALRLLARNLLGEPYAKILATAQAPNVLVYGAGSSGVALAKSLAQEKSMRVLGFLDNNPSLHNGQLMGINVYNPKDISELVSRLNIKDVFLALPSITRAERNAILLQLRSARVSVRTLPTLSDLAQGRIQASELRELDLEDLLGREAVAPQSELLEKNTRGKTVLVSGAGGSIGSELCRQIMLQAPTKLVLLELNEYALYTIQAELAQLCKQRGLNIQLIALIASVQDAPRIEHILTQHQPDTIYHAAAYKHVPIVEDNPTEGVKNNVWGTWTLAQSAMKAQVADFVLISTDKAVRPTNVMGASKRLAEMVLQALAAHAHEHGGPTTRFSMVRFGNVLGSSGSVVPKFRQQLKDGGPISLTHPEITRFFMTIPEAAALVIQAGALAGNQGERGEVFVLDMGEPVKILDLARTMVQLSGMTVRDAEQPDGDISIEITGLRPGEKLYEELLIGNNPRATQHPRIMRASEQFLAWPMLEPRLQTLLQYAVAQDAASVLVQMKQLVPEFSTATNVS